MDVPVIIDKAGLGSQVLKHVEDGIPDGVGEDLPIGGALGACLGTGTIKEADGSWLGELENGRPRRCRGGSGKKVRVVILDTLDMRGLQLGRNRRRCENRLEQTG